MRGMEKCFAKHVFMVKPQTALIPMVRINVVFPDILEPVSKIDFSLKSMLFFTQSIIKG